MMPWQDWTHPQGPLNLASHLEECDNAPDLGPKSYVAYGRCDILEAGACTLQLLWHRGL